MLMDKTEIIMSEIMVPRMANFQGNVHGGDILKLLDRVAYVCATRYTSKIMVTLSVDQVAFEEPVYVGELLTFYGKINFVGTTSLEVGIKVIAENLFTQQVRHTNSCYITMVALDEKGKPTKIKGLTLKNDIEKRRFNEALKRRENRLKKNAT